MNQMDVGTRRVCPLRTRKRLSYPIIYTTKREETDLEKDVIETPGVRRQDRGKTHLTLFD